MTQYIFSTEFQKFILYQIWLWSAQTFLYWIFHDVALYQLIQIA